MIYLGIALVIIGIILITIMQYKEEEITKVNIITLILFITIEFIFICAFFYINNQNRYDINKDGKVNTQDFALLKQYIQKGGE